MSKQQQHPTQPAADAPFILLGEVSDCNEVTITHAKTGRDFQVFYRDPTTRERVAYANSIVSRKGKRVRVDQATADLRGGLTVITGVEEGVLGRLNPATGKPEAISTDPESPAYCQDWKQLARESLGQELMLLGRYVFGGSTIGAEEPGAADELDGSDLGEAEELADPAGE